MQGNKAVTVVLALLGAVSIALIMLMSVSGQSAWSGQSPNVTDAADVTRMVGSYDLAGRSALSAPCDPDDQPDDQLDFDEQGIGTGSVPPTIAPAFHEVVEYLSPREPLLPQEPSHIDVRALLLPDTPHFTGVEKASVVLLI